MPPGSGGVRWSKVLDLRRVEDHDVGEGPSRMRTAVGLVDLIGGEAGHLADRVLKVNAFRSRTYRARMRGNDP